MLLVKTRLGISGIHGIGLFADQFIPKGTITWEYNPLFDTAFSEEEIAKMSEPSKKIFLHYAYFDKKLNKYVLCFDDQRFINHSRKKLNIHSTVRQDVASRDIQAGEELLCDYDKYDDTYFHRHGLKDANIIDNE
jgi:SET domain-containing protein